MSPPSHQAVPVAGMAAWLWAVAGGHWHQLYVVTITGLQMADQSQLSMEVLALLVTHTMWPPCYGQTEIQ